MSMGRRSRVTPSGPGREPTPARRRPGRPRLGLYDAATGVRRGVYATAPIPAGGQLTLSMTTIAATLAAAHQPA